MNSRFTRKNHSIDSLAALLLFAMYVLFLLFLMLFGAYCEQYLIYAVRCMIS